MSDPSPRDPLELALVVNPTAGGGRAGALVERVVHRLQMGSRVVRVVVGRDASHTAALTRAVVGLGTPTVVALGGDGLVNLALQATAGTDVVLGIVPAGTGNDIGRALGLSSNDPVAAVDVILRGNTRSIDLGRCGDRWFAAVLSTGFDSAVNERANRLRWPRGRARYDVAIAAELRTFRPFHYVIELDGQRLETEAMLIAVANGPSYGGGMRVCPNARLDDGLFDVMILRPVSKATFIRLFPRVYAGRHISHPAVLVQQARRVSIGAPDATAYVDGERLGSLPVSCEVAPAAARVLVP